MGITFRVPTDDDVAELMQNLRASDVEELSITSRLSVGDEILASVRASDPDLLVAVHDQGQLVYIFGCSPQSDGSAMPWLLATEFGNNFRKTLRKSTRSIVDRMLAKYPLLFNVIDERQYLTIRWLEAMGFEMVRKYEIKAGFPVWRFERRAAEMNTLTEFPEGIDFRAAILSAQATIAEAPQVDLPVTHHFSPGVYVRQMLIPAGLVVVGKIHKTEHLSIVNGDLDLATEFESSRLTGFNVFNSKPGIKRILVTHADTMFITIHATNETDVAKLEKLMAVDTYEQYDALLLESATNQSLEVMP